MMAMFCIEIISLHIKREREKVVFSETLIESSVMMLA